MRTSIEATRLRISGFMLLCVCGAIVCLDLAMLKVGAWAVVLGSGPALVFCGAIARECFQRAKLYGEKNGGCR